jgi:enoyl-CoA hydratase/carnithine racemase
VAIDNGDSNLLTPDVVDQLSTAIALAESDDEVKVFCLTGAGPSFFSAGVSWEHIGSSKGFLEKSHALASLLLATRKPTVSMIQGASLGAGVELSLLTDYRVASSKAIISFPEAGFGYPTVFSGPYMCAKICNPAISRKVFMLGETFTAEAALNVGLVDEVFDSSTFYEDAARFARNTIHRTATSELARHSLIEPDVLRLTFLEERSSAAALDASPDRLRELNGERARYLKASGRTRHRAAGSGGAK